MQLTDEEINFIGVCEYDFNKSKLRRIIRNSNEFFSNWVFSFKIEKGYKKIYDEYKDEVITSYIENDEIIYDHNLNIPSYMSYEGIFKFRFDISYSESRIKNIINILEKEFNKYIDFIIESNGILKIKIKDNINYMIEFEFLPHGLGIFMRVITRII